MVSDRPRDKATTRSLRVAVLASTLAEGGAETITAAACRGLARRGHAVTVCLARRTGRTGKLLEGEGFECHSQVAPSRADPLNVFRWLLLLRRCRPDVLYCLDHSNVWLPAIVAARILGLGGAAVAVHRTWRADGSPTFTRLDRFAMRWTDLCLALGESHARHLGDDCGVPAAKMRLVRNGVDCDHFRPPTGAGAIQGRQRFGLPDQVLVLAMVARLQPEKNHRLALEAVAADPIAGWHLVLAGEGPLRGTLESRARELGIANRCHWLGHRDDVADLLPLCDALIMPSLSRVETAPVAVLEAMASGLPVVASDVGCVREIVVNERSGLIVPPGSLPALVEALGRLAARPDLRADMGQAGRARAVADFTTSAMVLELERVLLEASRRHVTADHASPG